jgi:hypothetical protein
MHGRRHGGELVDNGHFLVIGGERLILRLSCQRNLFHVISIPSPATREHDPAVESRSAAFTARARLDADGVGDALDDVAKTHVFIDDEPRKPHTVGPRLAGGRVVLLRCQ